MDLSIRLCRKQQACGCQTLVFVSKLVRNLSLPVDKKLVFYDKYLVMPDELIVMHDETIVMLRVVKRTCEEFVIYQLLIEKRLQR